MDEGWLAVFAVCEGIFCGVLDVFEAVAFEFHSAKPAGDGDDSVGAVFFLEDAEDDHPSACFAVVALGLVDGTFVA